MKEQISKNVIYLCTVGLLNTDQIPVCTYLLFFDSASRCEMELSNLDISISKIASSIPLERRIFINFVDPILRVLVLPI